MQQRVIWKSTYYRKSGIHICSPASLLLPHVKERENIEGIITGSESILNSMYEMRTSVTLGLRGIDQSLPEDFFTFLVCLGAVEWNRFSLAGAIDIHIDICVKGSTDPEIVVETLALNADTSTAYKYTPHSAVRSTRFGIQGLKGIWMQGIGRTYVPQYFEMYVKNNHMLLISFIQGINQAFEDLHANIGLNF